MRDYRVEVTITATVTFEAESDDEAERIAEGVLDNVSHIMLFEAATDKEISQLNAGDDQFVSDKFTVTYGGIERAD
jgi:hypothetical protein